MNKEDLKKKVRCVVIDKCYYGGRIRENGEKLVVKRHEFSPTCLVAVDEKGVAFKKQPKRLDTKAVKAAFAAGGEAFAEQEKEKDFPLIGEAELKEASNSGSSDLGDEEIFTDEELTEETETVEVEEGSDFSGDFVEEEDVVESTEGGGAEALI